MTQINYGAKLENWAALKQLNLTTDLLPVVSNPNARISRLSSMPKTGKTPSIYNINGEVAGIPKWTNKYSSSLEVDKWMKQKDYGICIQTRKIRAFDIDIDDIALADDAVDFIDAEFKSRGYDLPAKRFRSNSGKCLLAFECVSENLHKRVIKCEGGMIEFLATGQQFIAFGHHSDGVYYEWEDDIKFPSVGEKDFEGIFKSVADKFAIAKVSQRGKRNPIGKQANSLKDEMLGKLSILGWGNEGQAFIGCPWADNHSMDSGMTQTAYFPKGGRGYDRGHFKCLHAGCEDKTDSNFIEALEIYKNDFDNIEFNDDGTKKPKPEPNFERNSKGEKLAIISNVYKALSDAHFCNYDISFDEFSDSLKIRETSKSEPQDCVDNDISLLKMSLENKGFKTISFEMVRKTVDLVASRNKYDSAQNWLNGITWDKTARVSNFLSEYFGAEPNDYTTACSLYLWSALAGRTLKPGIKADMVIVLIGAQGIGKSHGLSKMVENPSHYGTINLLDRDADQARRMRGNIISEFAELRGLNSRDIESIKEFITRDSETWIPKYKEHKTKYPRRCIFVGTTNQMEFLSDSTGNRRWLPIICKKVNVKKIETDRLQLWAEAKDLFKSNGILWQDAEKLAIKEHSKHEVSDLWEEKITEWLSYHESLDKSCDDYQDLTLENVISCALKINSESIKPFDQKRVTGILRKNGYERNRIRINKKLARIWVKK